MTQRGGAERVALIMAEAFPGAPLYTTLYDPDGTFAEFSRLDLRVGPLNRVGVLRRDHRLALPVLAPAVSATRVDADVLLASSSGWAHGMRCTGRTVVYCHAPARWLYQSQRYLGAAAGGSAARFRRAAAAGAVRVLGSGLRRWDRAAARRADRYLANSTVTRDAIHSAYGIDAEIVPPPPALSPDGPTEAVAGIEPGYLLCVARLLPYKNVDAVMAAAEIAGQRLVVVGDGPQLDTLRAQAGPDIRLLGRVPDEQLRWLYARCAALVAASYEDYGLSPLEAAGFGRPTVALGAGGYLDTVVPGRTGLFFPRPVPADIAAALRGLPAAGFSEQTLVEHAAGFSAQRFQQRLREVVAEVAG